MITWVIGLVALLAFFTWPDKIGRTIGFVVFFIAAFIFWFNLITNGV